MRQRAHRSRTSAVWFACAALVTLTVTAPAVPATGAAPTADAAEPADEPLVTLAAAVTVAPASALVSGQVVSVTGAGFTPDRSIAVLACVQPATSADDCDTSRLTYAQSDAIGAFVASFEVRRIVHTASKIVDCADVPGTCRVTAANVGDTSQSAFAPIAFDPAVPLPAPPRILVGPTTGLVQGQELALFGSGFPPDGAVRMYQCPAGAGTARCVELGWAPTDPSGGVVSVVPGVHRVLHFGFATSLDCASAVGACELLVQSASDRDAQTSVPLGFDPAGPLVAPSLELTPSTGLPFRTTVQAVGRGFPVGDGPRPGGFVLLQQCRAGALSQEQCRAGSSPAAGVDAGGGFTVDVVVRRVIRLVDGTELDCASAPRACELVAHDFAGPSARAALTFDPAAPVPPPPVVTLSPGGPLAYRAALTVTGTGFPPDSTVRLVQCEADRPNCADFSSSTFAQTDAGGSFSASLNVVRSIRSFAEFPPPVFDCGAAPGACVVQVQSEADEDTIGVAPLEFDPDAPIPEVTVTVTPSTELADFQIVDVHGEGFFPGDEVQVTQCTPGPVLPFGCGSSYASSVLVGDTGTFDTRTRVRRTVTSESFGPGVPEDVQCWPAPGACVMTVASHIDPNAVAEIPLAFRADPTPVLAPTITVDEPGPYDDGQVVTIRGSGYLPGEPLAIVECTGPPTTGGEGCGYAGPPSGASADEDGRVVVRAALHRTMRGIFGGRLIDCGFGEGTCRLVVAEVAGRSTATSGSIPITFRAPGAPSSGDATGPGETGIARAVPRRLALTGSDVRWPAAIGAASVIVGVALVIVGRTSRTRPRGQWESCRSATPRAQR